MALSGKRVRPLARKLPTFSLRYADLFHQRVRAFFKKHPYPLQKTAAFFSFYAAIVPRTPFFPSFQRQKPAFGSTNAFIGKEEMRHLVMLVFTGSQSLPFYPYLPSGKRPGNPIMQGKGRQEKTRLLSTKWRKTGSYEERKSHSGGSGKQIGGNVFHNPQNRTAGNPRSVERVLTGGLFTGRK